MDANPHQRPREGEALVFVYGTLLEGEANHGQLGSARCLGPARTAPSFELVDLGGFPGLVEGQGGAVEGELYACDAQTLARIDELEDHPDYFRRTPIELEDGRVAQTYVLPGHHAAGVPRLTGGDWRERAGYSSARNG
jgi:gamma-glutamylcyclotransferase (GGCT)/AIG2-like uncharacterized protein YtfP